MLQLARASHLINTYGTLKEGMHLFFFYHSLQFSRHKTNLKYKTDPIIFNPRNYFISCDTEGKERSTNLIGSGAKGDSGET